MRRGDLKFDALIKLLIIRKAAELFASAEPCPKGSDVPADCSYGQQHAEKSDEGEKHNASCSCLARSVVTIVCGTTTICDAASVHNVASAHNAASAHDYAIARGADAG